ncbi:MAG: RHS repeat-associated core domain-containing protein [Armatimonadetes bacterium]|nr:RHS repeat-associated core domain-containing protein [Armatimonadota bacterium]NOG39269.1 RHS repeat-associated core domain-containing protein [Armatimonadota bacterium]
MAVEDDNTVVSQNEPVVTVMRYGIGARGIDFLAKSVDGGAETKGFPLYDGHGNMIATLSRGASTPYFSVEDLRSYDVWGSVRSGSSTGDPKQRYCANLGHIQDDESGLIYMRARYYEPWSGRFISEDPDRADVTAFSYCRNSPTAFVDSSGRGPEEQIAAILANALSYLSRVYTRDTIVTVGNSLIRQLREIAAFQRIRAQEYAELATVARASGAVEAARTYEALGAKALAYAVSAELGVWQIRCMMAIAEEIMDIGIP